MSRKRKTIKRRNIGFTLSNVLKVLTVILLLLVLVCMIKTCVHCTQHSQNGNTTIVVYQTGYIPENEKWDSIPDINPPYDDDDLDSLPDKVSLERFFPPIEDQGNYGTCVAWATGYNLKTALNAIEHKWTKEQLDSAAYQTSPKDLWFSIPIEGRGIPGDYCLGTSFYHAFAALKKGVATMDKVPYTRLGDCRGHCVGDSTNRIAIFEGDEFPQLPTCSQIKAYLRDTVPLAFSAKTGNVFMSWHNDEVMKHDSPKSTGMHGNHAMVLSGYDDTKHAFRVRNSWGTGWGDNGSIWIDYDFFMNDFCTSIFVASNKPDNMTANTLTNN